MNYRDRQVFLERNLDKSLESPGSNSTSEETPSTRTSTRSEIASNQERQNPQNLSSLEQINTVEEEKNDSKASLQDRLSALRSRYSNDNN